MKFIVIFLFHILMITLAKAVWKKERLLEMCTQEVMTNLIFCGKDSTYTGNLIGFFVKYQDEVCANVHCNIYFLTGAKGEHYEQCKLYLMSVNPTLFRNGKFCTRGGCMGTDAGCYCKYFVGREINTSNCQDDAKLIEDYCHNIHEYESKCTNSRDEECSPNWWKNEGGYFNNGIKCGEGYDKCPAGECCGKEGYCGSTYEYCSYSKGCQIEYGDCRCGSGFGKCEPGYCCSDLQFCGTTKRHCSASRGCEIAYGDCKCGSTYGSCPSDYCCSKLGFCGTTNTHCYKSKGCQSSYGKKCK